MISQRLCNGRPPCDVMIDDSARVDMSGFPLVLNCDKDLDVLQSIDSVCQSNILFLGDEYLTREVLDLLRTNIPDNGVPIPSNFDFGGDFNLHP